MKAGAHFLYQGRRANGHQSVLSKDSRDRAEHSGPYVVVISLETPEGGKPGRATEVSRASAAQLIVEGKARLAGADEHSGLL